MNDLRYIVLCNDADRVYRLFDTADRKILRSFRMRLHPMRIAGAANRCWAVTGTPPAAWPWDKPSLALS